MTASIDTIEQAARNARIAQRRLKNDLTRRNNAGRTADPREETAPRPRHPGGREAGDHGHEPAHGDQPAGGPERLRTGGRDGRLHVSTAVEK